MGEEFLESLEQTGIGTFIRESSSYLGFPTVLTVHTFGLCFLVGANVIVCLRMLGLMSNIPLQPLRRLFPFMWIGLILTILSGGGLTLAAATTRALNPILLFKLAIIAMAAPVMWRIQKKIFNDPVTLAENKLPPSAKVFAMSQLAMWLLVMIAGRLIAYSATILGDGY
jgi:hypothetical protein